MFILGVLDPKTYFGGCLSGKKGIEAGFKRYTEHCFLWWDNAALWNWAGGWTTQDRVLQRREISTSTDTAGPFSQCRCLPAGLWVIRRQCPPPTNRILPHIFVNPRPTASCPIFSVWKPLPQTDFHKARTGTGGASRVSKSACRRGNTAAWVSRPGLTPRVYPKHFARL